MEAAVCVVKGSKGPANAIPPPGRVREYNTVQPGKGTRSGMTRDVWAGDHTWALSAALIIRYTMVDLGANAAFAAAVAMTRDSGFSRSRTRKGPFARDMVDHRESKLR
ncbi:hypothetical protein SVAN01_06525 [Stagonosporopsis vannaccii]|nr:hypothetical protein SVAN01_06525 [Stagonosporopsis vannaccii]